jgi:hypothetical protein
VEAGAKVDVVPSLNKRPPALEEPPVQALLGAGRRLLEDVERLFI